MVRSSVSTQLILPKIIDTENYPFNILNMAWLSEATVPSLYMKIPTFSLLLSLFTKEKTAHFSINGGLFKGVSWAYCFFKKAS